MCVLGLWILACWLVAGGHCYYFHPGYAHHYTYSAVNSMMDQRNVTTILKFHINFLGENVTGERLHSLHVDSFIQFMEGGHYVDNPKKWNLTKSFVFVNNATGGIKLVHVHPKDHKEVLTLKKAIVSVFSVHVQIDEQNDSWEYNTEETDHLGQLRHTYKGERTMNGLTLKRTHYSFDKLHRFHNKTLHYDDRGMLQSAVASDQVLIKQRAASASTEAREAEERKVTSFGKYPAVIEAVADVSVEYKGKRRIKPGNFQNQKEYIAKLRIDSLQTQHEDHRKQFWFDKVQKNITEAWNCIHYHYEPENENRSNCVNNLKNLLSRLNPSDYEKYVNHALNKNCSNRHQACQEDRLIVLDIAARMGDVISQRLLVTHVLSKPSPSDEDLRRVFIHCVAVIHPTPDFIKAVERFCFGVNGEHHGSRTLSRTQGRACLAVGSLAKHLSTNGQQQQADRLAHRLETWLDQHGKGDSQLFKQDTSMSIHEDDQEDSTEFEEEEAEEADAEHLTKAILLHSMGNSAMLRSRDRLLRHAEPNSGHHVWRRAALSALTQFRCEESARALLTSMTQDKVVSVRRMAWNGFFTHPQRYTVSRKQEDQLLSANYTYKSVARVKRSVLDIFDKIVLQFKVATPSYEWNRDIGTKQIGGKFGVKFHNSIEGVFRVLSGYVDVDVHDKLHASVHVLEDIRAELIHAEACYKGRLTYNMNIVKDFTVDLFKDINSVFDHIIRRVMEPMERLAGKLSSEYQDASTGQPISAFEPLAAAVKNLPTQTKSALKATEDFQEAADLLGVLPPVMKLQDHLSRAKAFLEDIHSEAAELFTDIDEETLIVLPVAEKEIKGAVNSVLGVLNKVKDFPNQAFSVIEGAKLRYQLAMMRILEATKTVKQAFSFLSGGRSSWNSGREELKNLQNQIESLVDQIGANVGRRKKRQTNTNFSPCATVELENALVTLHNKSGAMVDEVNIVLNHSPAELQRAMDLMKTQTETLKATFAAFKEAIDIIKSRIQALFGVKFHQSFPSIRRDCDEKCGCGYYPTPCKRYGHPGVDLVWNQGWKVPSPVTGMVYVETPNTTLRVEPKTNDLKEYSIYISNVELYPDYMGKKEFVIEAGQPLGFSLGTNGCNKGHIHVAMKRTFNTTGLCHYVNPTTFLQNNIPRIRWQQECNEFVFRHIGQVIDFSNFTAGFKSVLTKLKRAALDSMKDYAKEKLVELIPDDSFLKPLRDVGMKFLDNGTLDFSNIQNIFTKGVNATKDFMEKIKKINYSFKELLELAGNRTREFFEPKLKTIEDDVKNITKFPKTFKGIESLSIGKLTRLWKKISGKSLALPKFDMDDDSPLSILGKLGNDIIDELQGYVDNTTLGDLGNFTRLLDRLSGGKEMLIRKLKQTLREKVCPEIGQFLMKQGSPCIPHDDCWGLSCVISVQRKHVSGKVHINVKADKGSDVKGDIRTVHITVDGQEHTVTGDADDKVIPTTIKLFDSFDVKLRVTSSWQGDRLQFSLKLQACGPNLCCLPDVTLARNLSFSNFSLSSVLGEFDLSDLDLELQPLDTSYKVITDLDVESPELTNTILGLEDLIRDELGEYLPEDTTFKFYTEFHNPEDYADEGSFPMAGQRTEIYAEFFRYSFSVPLGIAELTLRISAGGAIGLQFNVKVKTTESLMQAGVVPYVSCKVEGGVSISIFVFAVGLDLHAYIMKVRFPLSLTTNYTKQPVIMTKKIELELIPLEFKLVAWFEIKIKIFFWTVIRKRWSKTIWHWRASGYRGTIWEKVDRKDDLGPPRFPYCDRVDQQCSAVDRRKRSAVIPPAVCMVRQLKDRHPRDSAFVLDFSVEDDDSNIKIAYSVGDYPGGTNVKSWTSMEGTTLTVSDKLPCGKPLYFLVRATNTQGLSTIASCSLPTYDCTFPDGRVDMATKCTNRRDKLSAIAIVYEDSELKPDRLFYSVGFSPGAYGHEIVDWSLLVLESTRARVNVSSNLRHFTPPRKGRLTFAPEKTLKSYSAEECALECLHLFTCVSFSFNVYSYACELQTVTEGVFARRVEDGHFYTYEKLGKGYSAIVELSDLALSHGVRYYVNSHVENVLNYQSVLTSQGTMVDFTPPEPGYLGEGAVEVTESADKCSVSVIQRCVDPSPVPRHKKFIDGKGSTTVLNGNKPGQELKFTMDNNHASANWNGFKDGECGIFGYTWAVGTIVCGSDVTNFADPHVNLTNPQDWPHVGLAKGLHLTEGPYYVTVQAVSDIQHGGDLVTTVCHSNPFIIDISPPLIHAVNGIVFDDGFRILAVYFNATDSLSGIARLEMGLGKTRHDVMIRRYLPYDIRGGEDSTYLVDEEFQTASGIPAWIRLKVVDNVGLWTTGSGNFPVLLDSTAPLPGHVMDGARLGQDSCCQADHSAICVQWTQFEDPESHIHSYLWGVGQRPGTDDVLAFHRLSSTQRHSCVTNLTLQHNVRYFSTVVAFNNALNQKSVNVSSNGVLVDLSAPIPGTVVDGDNIMSDVEFTSETSSIAASWTGFTDPETGIASYTVAVYVNSVLQHSLPDIHVEQFTDHSFTLAHGDTVHVEVTASNKAGSNVTVTSNGQIVDHTSPELVSIATVTAESFQQDDTSLHFVWQFIDMESGLTEYRCSVFQRYHGVETLFWPEGAAHHIIQLGSAEENTTRELHLRNLALVNGASYNLKVTAVNGAKMSATAGSTPVAIDITPPIVEKVRISPPGMEEEVNDEGEVEHIEKEPLYVSWKVYDFQSGLSNVQLCVGLVGSDCLTSGNVLSLDPSSLHRAAAVLDQTELQVSTEEDKVLYEVLMVVVNGAGVRSAVARSRPIIVLRGNIPGLVLDGSSGIDEDFTNDFSGISVLFSNFSSQACGIEGYDWGVGSTPCQTDILPFSDFGLVMDPVVDGSGSAQADIMLTEGKTYYTIVRARTGHACHEPFIVSCSDGITIDLTPPAISFFLFPKSAALLLSDSQVLTSHNVVYQATANKLRVGWSVADPTGVNSSQLSLELQNSTTQVFDIMAIPEQPFPLEFTFVSGDSLYSSLWVADNAGNEVMTPLPVVTFDFTKPSFENLRCTDIVSTKSSSISCTWTTISEPHSALQTIKFGLGSGPANADLYNMTEVHLSIGHWNCDMADISAPGFDELSKFYVVVQVSNAADLEGRTSVKITRDLTPPAVDEVVVVTSSEGGVSIPQKCQTSHDFIEIELLGAQDDESGVQRVEIALGTSKGTTDIHPFQVYNQFSGIYARRGLDLTSKSTVFVTAKVTNGVGLYTVVMSDGIAVSPEPRLEVTDGLGEKDIDGQAVLSLIQGRWRFTHPCPVLTAEWSVTELGSGRVLRPYTAIPNNDEKFYDDALVLDNLKTYVSHVKINDALNRTFTAFSDGVTVSVGTPEIASVWEGSGAHDVDFQESLDTIVAAWGEFGNSRSALPSDHVVRYEVSLGTDPLETYSRINVHRFVDVGLATTHTFVSLNLTARNITYYVTVRAYSAAGTFSEGYSDGIKVGISDEITPGRVDVDPYQSSTTSIRTVWEGFKSDMGDLSYYVGVSSVKPGWKSSTVECNTLLDSEFVFDTMPLQPVDAVNAIILDDLSLLHNGTYFVTVIAEDLTSSCSAAVSHAVVVDTTRPIADIVAVDGYDTGPAIFLQSTDTIAVDVNTFFDQESGIKTVTVELIQTKNCGDSTMQEASILTVVADNNTRVTLRELNLQEDVAFLLRMTVTNGARLDTQVTSKPLLLPVSHPSPGDVRLGQNWTDDDALFQGQTHTIYGMIALLSSDVDMDCNVEVNPMPTENESEWVTIVTGGFSRKCTLVNNSEIFLTVQHNVHLTDVDKGAIQLSNLTPTVGNYSFRFMPASGANILTGISLASSSLQPPILSINNMLSMTSTNGDCEVDVDICNQNTSVEESPTQNGHGMGVSFVETNGMKKVMFWVQDHSKLHRSLTSLDFDPFLTFANYTFNLKHIPGGAWKVEFSVNGKSEYIVSGFRFPGDLKLSFYTWNMDGYVPPVTDPFNPFKSVATLYGVLTPLPERPLCSYGSPYHDAHSGIKEVWAGVSDNVSTIASVIPFHLIKTFCQACLLECLDICSESCGNDSTISDFHILPITLTNVSLKAASDFISSASSANSTDDPNVAGNNSTYKSMNDFRLPMYYLDVKIVSNSGRSVVSKSPALTIDTTPPFVVKLFCTDPSYSDDEAVEFIGTNQTVGVRWEVSENISDVVAQWVSMGSRPGLDDIVQWMQVNRAATSYVLKDLGKVLEDNMSCHVSLRVTNAAGLSVISSSTITLSTSIPVLFQHHLPDRESNSDAVKTPVFEDVTAMMEIADTQIAFMEPTDRLTLNLPPINRDILYLEWSIGTQQGANDVLPKVIVANPNVTKVAIVRGRVEVEGFSTNITVGDYVRSSFRPSQPKSTDEDDPSALFKMEPGRCLRQQLFGVSKSHRENTVDLFPLCFMRQNDHLVTSDNASTNLQTENDITLTLSRLLKNRQQKRFVESGKWYLNAVNLVPVSNGGMIVGSLNQPDVSVLYGTAASAEFSPFIVDPEPTDPTSRSLNGRLLSTLGPYFYLSPVADMQLNGDVLVTYTIPASVNVPSSHLAELLFWSAESRKWMSVRDVCPANQQSYDSRERKITAKMCFEVFVDQSKDYGNEQRRKRDARDPTPISLFSRMWMVAVVDRTIRNIAPVLSDLTLTVTEDTKEGVSATITYFDNDGDHLMFTLLEQPHHGTAVVTPEGVVTYWPAENYVGDDVIAVQGSEVLDTASLSQGLSPNVVSVSVFVEVLNVNDPPEIFFISDASNDNTFFQKMESDNNTAIKVSVLVEGNRTTVVPLGTVVLGDADVTDQLFLLNRSRDDSNATFLTTNAESKNLTKAVKRELPYKTEAKALLLSLVESYRGLVSYDARVKDESDAYSVPLSVEVHVLTNPCFHGHCESTVPGGTCQHPKRTFSFDTFRCLCDHGFEGEWCERETDECGIDPCNVLMDCVDLLGDYRCEINVVKIVAVVCGGVLGLLVVSVVMCFARKRIATCHDGFDEDNTTDRSSIDMSVFSQPTSPDSFNPQSSEAMNTVPSGFQKYMRNVDEIEYTYELVATGK